MAARGRAQLAPTGFLPMELCRGGLRLPAGVRSTPRRRGLRARKTPPARVGFLVRFVTAPLQTEAHRRWASVWVLYFMVRSNSGGCRGGLWPPAGERSSPLQGFFRWSYVGAPVVALRRLVYLGQKNPALALQRGPGYKRATHLAGQARVCRYP